MLRQNISVVLQDSVLFEGSIRENLEIGRPGASLEELIDACIKANIHETIANLPDGYDTNVREQGNNFSAGQRQRLGHRLLSCLTNMCSITWNFTLAQLTTFIVFSIEFCSLVECHSLNKLATKNGITWPRSEMFTLTRPE